MKPPLHPIHADQILRAPFQRPILLGIAFFLSLILTLTNTQETLYQIDSPLWVLSMGVLILLTPLFNGIFILLARSVVREEGGSLQHALNGTLSDYPRLVIAGILSNLLVVAGMFLFVLPGIYIGLRLSFYKQAILIDRRSVTAALTESLRRTTGWRIPLALLLFLAPFYGISILAIYAVNIYTLGLVGEGLLLVVSALTFAWTNTLLTTLYLSNQEIANLRKEGQASYKF